MAEGAPPSTAAAAGRAGAAVKFTGSNRPGPVLEHYIAAVRQSERSAQQVVQLAAELE
eukprot:SAG22_NODE_8337_length_663_cov_0.923759_1_plen_57_part_10